MKSLCTILLGVIFLMLSSIHFYWGFGGAWGKEASIPAKANNSKVFSPSLLATFTVAMGLLGFGLFIFIKGRFLAIPIPLFIDQYGLWLIVIIFLTRAIGEFKYVGFFKKIKHTKFGQNDTKYYSPLCLIIGIWAIILELQK